MSLADAKMVVDALSKAGFAVAYFTGGETGLYPYLTEIMEYAKGKGFLTSLTTNGSVEEATLNRLSDSLDVISVSVDHYDEAVWEQAKHLPGVAGKAKQTIKTAAECGIKVYAITFLNPSWNPGDVEKIIRYVNDELDVSFTLSYPYISSGYGSFVVGGNMRSNPQDLERNMAGLVSKVLEMKSAGFKVANATCYLRDVLRALSGSPMKYPCMAGETIISIDCDLNVFPCYKKPALFNLKTHPSLDMPPADNSGCDNKSCLINGYKEPSLAARGVFPRAAVEELMSNPAFYLKMIM
jgi:MoaA/NifB/PqqE/SkfB family radical SAM enzyme